MPKVNGPAVYYSCAFIAASLATAVAWTTHDPKWLLGVLISAALSIVVFMVNRGAEQRIADVVVGRLQPYLDGLPRVKDPAIKDPYDAGVKLMKANKWDEAIAEFRRALPAARATQLVALYNLIGLCHCTPGRFDEALAAYNKSLDLAREFRDKEGEANALGNIALIHQDRGDLDKALKYHEDALKIDREIGYQQGAADELGNIGLIYQDKGDLDKALKYSEDALKIHREIGYQQGAADELGNIGNLLVRKGECDRAIGYLVPALSMFNRMGIADGPRQCLAELRGCLAALGRDRFLAACEEAKLSRKDAEALVASLEAQPSQPAH